MQLRPNTRNRVFMWGTISNSFLCHISVKVVAAPELGNAGVALVFYEEQISVVR